MSSEELAEWMAYERLEPFGETRADIRTALVCSTLANINRDKKVKPYKIQDFMLDFDSVWSKPTAKELDRRSKVMESAIKSSAPKGTFRVYEGDAPAVRRIGKRARPNKKLDRILYGEPR